MNRMRVALVHKIVPVSILAILLFCAPLELAAQEKESRAAAQVPLIEWGARLWNDFTAWLAGGGVPILEPPPQSQGDNGCIVDPNGGCGG